MEKQFLYLVATLLFTSRLLAYSVGEIDGGNALMHNDNGLQSAIMVSCRGIDGKEGDLYRLSYGGEFACAKGEQIVWRLENSERKGVLGSCYHRSRSRWTIFTHNRMNSVCWQHPGVSHDGSAVPFSSLSNVVAGPRLDLTVNCRSADGVDGHTVRLSYGKIIFCNADESIAWSVINKEIKGVVKPCPGQLGFRTQLSQFTRTVLDDGTFLGSETIATSCFSSR